MLLVLFDVTTVIFLRVKFGSIIIVVDAIGSVNLETERSLQIV